MATATRIDPGLTPESLHAHGRVLVIGGTPIVLGPAGELGLELSNVQRPGLLLTGHQRMTDQALVADFADTEEMLTVIRAWHARRPFVHALSFLEEGLVPAALVREALGLGGTPASTTRLLRDKAAMRDRLAGSPLASVAYARCDSAEDVAAFGLRAGYPLIIKPRDGVRGWGVRRVDSPADIAEAVAAIRSEGHPRFLAEGLLGGRELTVESVSRAGVHRVVSINEDFIGPGHRGAGHVTPARITADEAAAVMVYAEQFLGLMGIVSGNSHTQLFLTEDRGPVVIESHDRVGMGLERALALASYGHDLYRLAYSVPAGLDPLPPPLRREGRPATAVWFLFGAGARLVDITGADEAAASEGVIRMHLTRKEVMLDRVIAPTDRPGHVIATGDTPDQALDRARAAAGRIELHYASE